jgi:hypothetical protein
VACSSFASAPSGSTRRCSSFNPKGACCGKWSTGRKNGSAQKSVSISSNLKQEGDWTIVLFKHQGWKDPVEFMHHCSTKWGVFLLSLKSLLETGKGAPWPNEIKLDSWE